MGDSGNDPGKRVLAIGERESALDGSPAVNFMECYLLLWDRSVFGEQTSEDVYAASGCYYGITQPLMVV